MLVSCSCNSFLDRRGVVSQPCQGSSAEEGLNILHHIWFEITRKSYLASSTCTPMNAHALSQESTCPKQVSELICAWYDRCTGQVLEKIRASIQGVEGHTCRIAIPV